MLMIMFCKAKSWPLVLYRQDQAHKRPKQRMFMLCYTCSNAMWRKFLKTWFFYIANGLGYLGLPVTIIHWQRVLYSRRLPDRRKEYHFDQYGSNS